MSDNKKVLNLIFARFLGTLAFQIIGFYGFFKTFDNLKSPLLTGLIGLALYLPSLLIGPIAGIYTNKIKNSGKIYQLLIGLQVLPIIFIFNKNDNYYIIFLSIFLLSIIRSIRSPLYYKLIKSLNYQTSTTAKYNTFSWLLPLILAPIIVNGARSLNINDTYSLIFAFILLLYSIIVLNEYREITTYTADEDNKFSFSILKKINIKKDFKVYFPFISDTFLTIFFGLNTTFSTLLYISYGNTNFGLLKFVFHVSCLLPLLILNKKLHKVTAKSFGIVLILWPLVIIPFFFSQSIYILFILIGLFGMIDGFSSFIRDKILISRPSHLIGITSSFNTLLISTGDELGEVLTGIILNYFSLNTLLTINIIISITLITIHFKTYFKRNEKITLFSFQ